MDEYVLPAFALDEPVTFCGVKPLDCTLFLHTALCPCWIGIAICGDGNGGNTRRSAVTPLVARPEGSWVAPRSSFETRRNYNNKLQIQPSILWQGLSRQKTVVGQFDVEAALRRHLAR
jgi:hypothetical protein